MLKDFNLFFYIVLDNIAQILKMEKQKKMLEKLCILQSLTSPACLSILVINDSPVNEILVFKEYTNIFEEFMFFTFYLKPMNETQLKRIMNEVLSEYYPEDPYLEKLYDNFFNVIHTLLENYTTNINEYAYIF